MKHFYILLLLFPVLAYPGNNPTDHSVLAQGRWWKIAVQESGIHKITYEDMVTLGMNPSSANPANFRIYGNGGNMLPEANSAPRPDDLLEVAAEVVDGGDGTFDPGDYLIFYASGPRGWVFNKQTSGFNHYNNLYSDKSFYFITEGNIPGKRTEAYIPPDTLPDYYSQSFTELALFETDSFSLIKSGKSWYGDIFNASKSSYSLRFNIPSVNVTKPAKIVTSVAAKSSQNCFFYISVNDEVRDTIRIEFVDPSSTSVFAKGKIETTLIDLPGDQFDLNYLFSMPNSDAQAWLDYIEFSCTRNLEFAGPQMSFRDPFSVKKDRITRFTLGNITDNVRIWDVTEAHNAMNVSLSPCDSGYYFLANTDSIREYIGFDGSFYYPVETIGEMPNQDLHGLSPAALIIVSPALFKEQAERLAAFHMTESNLSSHVVDIDQIYNEFSSGKKDIGAIRDFMKRMYDRASDQEKPRYLLLFGDGSYDPKNRVPGNNDMIPTFQSNESLKPIATYLSDDFFGIMSNSGGTESAGKIDIGIGRFPVTKVEDAKIVVDKIINYASATDTVLSDWRNTFTFIADDENSNLHMHQAEELVEIVETRYPVFNVNKIYLDAYKMVHTTMGDRLPQVNEAINSAIEKGTLILNYTGHGGEEGWSGEKVMTLTDVSSWENYNKLPVFVTATCEFSRFDNPERITGGELVLLQPHGGAIALYSTTRQALATANFKLDTSFFRNLIPPPGQPKRTMGDLIRISKNNNNNNYTIRNFVLLGDPAQTIAFPEYNVVTTEINGNPAGTESDTLLGLQSVTINGEVRTQTGEKLSSFNGLVYPKMYDKKTGVMTIGNTSGSYPEMFRIRNKLLYSGVIPVSEGEFSFSFVIPSGVGLPVDIGKLSYYAKNETTDANGYDLNVVTGGRDLTVVPDMQGPQLDLYMDNTSFRSGGTTGKDTKLIAFLEDPQGINFIDLGIGHEIVMIADNGDHVVLNEFYIPETGIYGRGSVVYEFNNLAPGRHTINLKAWDMFNNSSTKEISFFVHEGTVPVITSLSSYPNPFSGKTTFTFIPETDNGQPKAEIRVYSITGQPVATINEFHTNGGYLQADWSGTNDNGQILPAGIYLYTISATSENGDVERHSGKVIKAD